MGESLADAEAAVGSDGAQSGNDGGLHEFPAWCCGVVLPNPQSRSFDVEQVVVLAVEMEGNFPTPAPVKGETGNSFGQPGDYARGLHDGEGWCSSTLCVMANFSLRSS